MIRDMAEGLGIVIFMVAAFVAPGMLVALS